MRIARTLRKEFYPSRPNLVWVSDITYIRAGSRFYYVCVVIDLFSGKVIAYKTSDRINTALVLETFRSACRKREDPKEVMFHSDRGSQYTSAAFRQALDCNLFQQKDIPMITQ